MKGGKVVAGLVAEPWPPVPQWELDAETPSSFLGQRGFLRYFTNAKGLRIAAYFWPSTRNDVSSRRGTIVAVHGHGAPASPVPLPPACLRPCRPAWYRSS